MKFAYADPPYVGQAKRHYSHDPRCAEVDHRDLVNRLIDEYPDGWALSCSSPSLQEILSICPSTVRVMAWVKPFCSFKANVNPAYAWEPVIVNGGRRRSREQSTVRDWVSANIALKRGLHGAKPKEFCYWLFDVLNILRGDSLDDLFPGSGAVTSAFAEYVAQTALVGSPMFAEEYRQTSESRGNTERRDSSPGPARDSRQGILECGDIKSGPGPVRGPGISS